MKGFITYIKGIYRKDTALSHLVLFIYKFLGHWICDFAITGVGIVIALLTAKAYFGIWLWLAVIVNLLLVAGVSICKQYERQEKESKTTENHMLITQQERMNDLKKDFLKLNGKAANDIYRVARMVKRDGWPASKNELEGRFCFQTMAFEVCEDIYEILRTRYGLQNHCVTIFQRFNPPENHPKQKPYCKMVAYFNHNRKEPMSYQIQYKIPKQLDPTKKIEYHTRIFAEDDVRPRILMTQGEVAANFVFHPKCKTRELLIHQYIGIPVSVCNRSIMFLVQIDCDVEYGFGQTVDDVQAMITLILEQYVSLLTLYYEVDRLNSVTYERSQKKADAIEKKVASM